MIYYYLVNVKFFIGTRSIIKEYRKSFLEMGELFDYLEKRHRDNYILMSIIPLHYTRGYQNKYRK